MLDLAFVRANLPLVEEKLRARGQNPAELLGDFHSIDTKRRERITEVEQLKAQRNKLSDEVARLKKSGQDATAVMDETRSLKQKIDTLEAATTEAEEQSRSILQRIPNLPHESVPVGKSEHDNVEIKRWGKQPEFDFQPKPHWELGEALGILDFERAAKISGARFAVYWAEGARLERALINLMLDIHTREHGYTEVLPPFMVNSKSLFGTGQLPKFAADLFRCEDEQGYKEGEYRDSDHWLIPTAEVPVTNLYRDETLDEAKLTVSLTAYTPCFRSEAGSYGKDVRGIIRQHQFQKVELVKFAKPEESYDELEKLTANAEAILEKLGLPYRRVLLCTGDMGFSSAKTYDLEVWLPGQGLYREISSCSNFEAFQARRANIRYRPQGKGKTEFVHTLNGSGLAIGRTWLAILENYQQADGSVCVPEVLVPYMGGQRVITRR
ncbi:MAG TPA: serine--tRNA ligase [Pseudacidobacterium sp.]|jgi:seryl-tRNA synthetase|nr:serine--tRNA ligase [Pseudacidobacterium sp.]